MGDIFFVILIQPMINLLVFFYGLIPDLGVAIILLTLLIKIVLFPLNWKSLKVQKQMRGVQEKINEIKSRVTDQQQQALEIMNLYKKEKVNPLSSCLPLVLQLLVLIALINVLNKVIDPNFNLQGALYPFINYVKLHTISFGFLDLTKKAVGSGAVNYFGIFLAVLSGVLQYIQTKMMTPKQPSKQSTQVANTSTADQITSSMNKQMLYVFPLLTIWIGLSFPMGLTLYWVASTLFSIAQQAIILYHHDKNDKPGTGNHKVIDVQKVN